MTNFSSTAPEEQYFEDDAFTRTYYDPDVSNGVANIPNGVTLDQPKNSTDTPEHAVHSDDADDGSLLQDREIVIRNENRDRVLDFNKRLKRSAIGLSILSVILISMLVVCIIFIVKLKTAIDQLEKQCHNITLSDQFGTGT